MVQSVEDDIPILEAAVDPRFETAAQLLDRAAQSMSQDSNVVYMLALAYKRQGKLAEARAALRKISKPDANVFLQLGLVSLREGQPAQAQEEFARAWQMDSTSFAVAQNLLMTRLSLGQNQASLELLPAAQKLAPSAEHKRLLVILEELLKYCRPETIGEDQALIVLELDSPLETLTPPEEQQLIKMIRGLGNLEVSFSLIRTLAMARPRSPAVLEAHYECALARGRDLLARCRWTEASFLLEPLTRERASRSNQAALNNLLGCCYYVTSDFDRATRHFNMAVKQMPNDPRLQQNLALALERTEDAEDAEEHWTKFLDLLDRDTISVPTDVPRYMQSLEHETLVHLANFFTAKEKWSAVLNYLNRAHRLKPDDPDLLERMFFAYTHAKQSNNARKTLDKMRSLRPNDPQLDLYELDLVEVKNLSDIERMLTEIEHILRRHPDDHRVEERAVSMVGGVVPLMGNLCDQLTEQLNKVMGQVGNLPRYQVDWSALREIMRDLMKEFQKLRRITGKCLPLVSSDEHKRIVRDLSEHIDQKIESCRQMGA
jgi:Flp pilus assembly protein TadD